MNDFKHVLLPELYQEDDVTGFIIRCADDDNLVLHGDWNEGRLEPLESDFETGIHDYLYDAMVSVAQYYRSNGEPFPYHEEWKMMIDFIDAAYPHIDGPEGGREAPRPSAPAAEPVYEQVTEENVMEFI